MSTVPIDTFRDTDQPASSSGDSSWTLLHGASSATQRLRARLRNIAPYFRTALITGEQGSGKRRVAHELHRLSHPDGPFLFYSPAETDLHGRDSGISCRPHTEQNTWAELFESAQGGTLVLEKLGDFSAQEQTSLVHFLQNLRWKSWAEPRTQIVAVSREPSRVLRSTGRLQEELYRFFSALEIQTQPLRDRPGDIEALADEFLSEAAAEVRVSVPRLSAEALAYLQRRPWLGNVRELRSVLREALERQAGPVLVPESFETGQSKPTVAAHGQTSMLLQDAMDAHITKVLAFCCGNKLKTAELLGISRSRLYRILETMPSTVP